MTSGDEQKRRTTDPLGTVHRPGAYTNAISPAAFVGMGTKTTVTGSSDAHSMLSVKGRILVVDDELAIVRAYTKSLGANGYQVETASDGVVARQRLQESSFDAVICDVAMPGLDGLSVLRAMREHNPDVPVILLTGSPTEEDAVKAIENGALLYLVKPIELRSLVQVVDNAVRLCRLAKRRREALPCSSISPVSDLPGLECLFQRAMSTLRMEYQPIVRWPERTVFAYEALMRSDESPLAHPLALLGAAERLGRLPLLGRAVRDAVAASMRHLPPGAVMFVNLHTSDLLDAALFSPDAPLSHHAPRVVLEINERASFDGVRDLAARILALRAMGYRVAIDNLGACHAGLTTLIQLQPDVVKLDMSIVRDLDRDPVKSKLVGAMVAMGREIHALVIAEGVERIEERDTLRRLGCEMLQGHLFARPGRQLPEVTW